MHISVKMDKILFVSETGMDLFWLGVISSKNKCEVSWENGAVTSMTMSKKDVITGLGCTRV